MSVENLLGPNTSFEKVAVLGRLALGSSVRSACSGNRCSTPICPPRRTGSGLSCDATVSRWTPASSPFQPNASEASGHKSQAFAD